VKEAAMADTIPPTGFQKVAPYVIPALSFLVVTAGILWSTAAWKADFEASLKGVKDQLAVVGRNVSDLGTAREVDRQNTVTLGTRISVTERDLVNFTTLFAQSQRQAERTEDKIDELLRAVIGARPDRTELTSLPPP
jgi:hypothetical protein